MCESRAGSRPCYTFRPADIKRIYTRETAYYTAAPVSNQNYFPFVGASRLKKRKKKLSFANVIVVITTVYSKYKEKQSRRSMQNQVSN